MNADAELLVCESDIHAYIEHDIESVQRVNVLGALRSQRPAISQSDLETAIVEGAGIYLLTLDSTNLQNFFVQLDQLHKFVKSIEFDKLAIRLVESYLELEISLQIIEESIAFHRRNEFAVVPTISSLLQRLEDATWLKSQALKLGSNCETVDEFPQEFERLGEAIFAISYYIGQRLTEADYHQECIPHCLRVMNAPVDGLVQSKLQGSNLAECWEFVALISQIIKWACVQLFYEPEGEKEFVQWCDLISCGYLPVGWNGPFNNGRLVLYAEA